MRDLAALRRVCRPAQLPCLRYRLAAQWNRRKAIPLSRPLRGNSPHNRSHEWAVLRKPGLCRRTDFFGAKHRIATLCRPRRSSPCARPDSSPRSAAVRKVLRKLGDKACMNRSFRRCSFHWIPRILDISTLQRSTAIPALQRLIENGRYRSWQLASLQCRLQRPGFSWAARFLRLRLRAPQ
jgi:hypothetical protein